MESRKGSVYLDIFKSYKRWSFSLYDFIKPNQIQGTRKTSEHEKLIAHSTGLFSDTCDMYGLSDYNDEIKCLKLPHISAVS